MMACCITHPLDTLKVYMQVNEKSLQLGGRPPGMYQTALSVVRTQGVSGLYKGLSAALMRQATYSTTRFAVYDAFKSYLDEGGKRPLKTYEKFGSAMFAGAVGGFVGNPMDVANVRMQADAKLPEGKRRAYRHVFDALRRMVTDEGFFTLYKGLLPNIQRGMLMTMGQLATYDEIKQQLLTKTNGLFKDNFFTYALSSTLAGGVATLMTQPVDVVKTRMMMAAPGRYSGTLHCMRDTVRSEGMLALYKGVVPSFTRLGPHTVLTFVFLEQIRTVYAQFVLNGK